MTPTADDVERTRRVVLAGLWIDAVLVMAASAWNSGRALETMGDSFGFGVLLGLAVDVGLAASLVGDRALHLRGRSEPWGRAVRVTTALMSLGLNCAVAIRDGNYAMAVFHAFLPILLILLSEYQQSSTLQFGAIADDRAATERAERDAAVAAERAAFEARQREQRELELRRANGELVDATDVLAKAAELRAQAEREIATAAELRATKEGHVAATKTAEEQLRELQRKTTADDDDASNEPAAPAPRAQRRDWVRARRAQGRPPSGADVDTEFGPPRKGSKSRTGAAIVAEVIKEENESRRAAVHAVKGGN